MPSDFRKYLRRIRGKYRLTWNSSIRNAAFAAAAGTGLILGTVLPSAASGAPDTVLVFVPDVMFSNVQRGPFNFLPRDVVPLHLARDPMLDSLLLQMASGVKGKWHLFPSPVMQVMVDPAAAQRAVTLDPRRHPGLTPAPMGMVRSVAPVLVERGNRRNPSVALTFDACAGRGEPKLDQRVTDTLTRLRVPATIFVSGAWAYEAPDLLRRLAFNPLFEIGNHSYSHPHLTRVSEKQMIEEIEWTQDVIRRLTGRVPRLFRAPFGEVDERLVENAALLGLRTIQYDVASGDPDPRATREGIISWVLGQARNGSIVVMHINRRGWHTADALPDIVGTLRRKGYRLVRVSDLLQG